VSVPVRNDFAFRHYSDDVVTRLADYVSSPDAEPVEALVLYLIIFHAFSVWELAHALLPKGETNNAEIGGLSDAYYVVLPKREPTRRNLAPGRPERRVEFPDSAATWLKPLLRRYERWRKETLGNPNNNFLLIAPGRARHDNPVCREFVRRVVKRGSIGAGVGECNPKRLRATAATSFADSGVVGVLTGLGWSASQGFKFTWSERREVVNPRRKSTRDLFL
jgi:integrase